MLAAPSWIPFGAHVLIPGLGVFTVQDRGGGVWGNHLDIFMDYPGEHYVADWYRGVYWW
jgi:3D (Asp-Asp-Asp) domain-containing protein